MNFHTIPSIPCPFFFKCSISISNVQVFLAKKYKNSINTPNLCSPSSLAEVASQFWQPPIAVAAICLRLCRF
jgi:hypothetical protein